MNVHRFDVAVCGGGTAGFCAAVAAARRGARTVVLEKYGMLGGTMTLGGVPAPALFHAHGRQIIAGVGWELMLALARAGYASLPEPPYELTHSRLAVEINAFEGARFIDRMLAEAGAQVYFHQPVVDVAARNGRIERVLIASPQGLEAVEAAMYVDASGDGDVSCMAGAECELADVLQPGSLNAVLGGFDPLAIDLDVLNAHYRRAMAQGDLLPGDVWAARDNAGTLLRGRGRGARRGDPSALNPGSNVNHVFPLNTADAPGRSRAEARGRESLHRLAEFLRRVPGCEGAHVAACAPYTAARESRRVLGRAYITGQDYIAGLCPPDALCYSFYPIDIHQADERQVLINEFHERGKVPGIPYGALLPKGFDNLLTAGRIISGDRRAQSAYRVQASCMAMGEAAGAAAALAARADVPAQDVDPHALRESLREGGAIVPEI